MSDFDFDIYRVYLGIFQCSRDIRCLGSGKFMMFYSIFFSAPLFLQMKPKSRVYKDRATDTILAPSRYDVLLFCNAAKPLYKDIFWAPVSRVSLLDQ